MERVRDRTRKKLGRRMEPSTPSSNKKSLSDASPPWEAVVLLAKLLDPKSLAVASCVSKSWFAAMSADHLWKRICLSQYPSSLHLLTEDDSSSSNRLPLSGTPRRLFALLHASSQRRLRGPPAPRISLHNLTFLIDIFRGGTPLLAAAKPGGELDVGHGGVFSFRFRVAVDHDIDNDAKVVDAAEELRVVWKVVMEGWRGAFAVMDRTGKGLPVGGAELWFSELLPGPVCFSASAGGGGGPQADLGLEFCGGREGRVGWVSLGLMSAVRCRYMSVDDALLYLQPYLLPSNV